MKKIFTLLITLTLLSSSSYAHCGSCGADDHKHDEKTATKTSAKVEMSSIIETAKGAKTFTILLAALEAAGLDKALSGVGPFTVFAPTDEAFAALPEGTVEALLKDKEKLTAILTYHVVDGYVQAKDVTKLDKAQTLNGKNVAIKVIKESVMFGKANVLATDIACSNGIIHVIDKVLLP